MIERFPTILQNFYAGSQRLDADLKKNQRHDRRKVKSLLQQNNPNNSIFYSNFTSAELNEAICLLRCGKSPGPDPIHSEFLKNLGPSALLALMNRSCGTVLFPLYGQGF